MEKMMYALEEVVNEFVGKQTEPEQNEAYKRFVSSEDDEVVFNGAIAEAEHNGFKKAFKFMFKLMQECNVD